jgi:hypothetical protein
MRAPSSSATGRKARRRGSSSGHRRSACRADDALHRDLRVGHPRPRPLGEELDRLIDVDRKPLEPGVPVRVVLHRLERHRVGDLVGGLDSAPLVDGEQVEPKRLRRDRFFETVAEQVVAESVFAREILPWDPTELREDVLVVLITARLCREADVVPAVGVPHVAELRGPDRALAHLVFPLGVEERVERPRARVLRA